jgi:hypothetical protein
VNLHFYFYFKLLYTSQCWSRRTETCTLLRVYKYRVMLDSNLTDYLFTGSTMDGCPSSSTVYRSHLSNKVFFNYGTV